MRKLAYIFSIIETVFLAILILPLAWNIPITIYLKKAMNDNKENIALGVFRIVFSASIFGLISGILFFIPDNKDKKALENKESENKELGKTQNVIYEN